MKKTLKKEVHICDQCGKEDPYPYACLHCGKEMCYACVGKHGVHYSHAVYLRGSDDGHYCKECDAILTAANTDRRHRAYRAVKLLKQELETWHTDFKKRQDAAEKLVASFNEKQT